MPRVSVIIPAYNVEEYVGACIRSLQEQEYPDFEAIIVDDASTDGTVEAATEAIGTDPRCQLLRQPETRGQSAARTVALEHARGEFVCNLDADDAYVPHTLLMLVDAAIENALDAVFFTATMDFRRQSYKRTNYENHANRTADSSIHDGFGMLEEFVNTNSFRPSACFFMLRRSVIEDNHLRFAEGIIHEDLLFTMNIFPHLERAMYLNQMLYVRRMRDNSTMTTPPSERNLAGLLAVGMSLDEQLRTHVGEWPATFCDAWAHQLFDNWDVLAHYVLQIDQKRVEAFRDSLDPQARAAFVLHGIENARYMDAAAHAITDTRTFKAGRVIMAVPSWVKSRFFVKVDDENAR